MKYCEDYAALLDPYIDGELSPEDTARVREHLTMCGGCRAYVQAALLLRENFPEIEEAEVPDGFAESVMGAIRSGAAPQKKRRTPWAKVLLPLAACCAIVILVRGLPMGVTTADTASSTTQESTAPTASESDSTASDSAAVARISPPETEESTEMSEDVSVENSEEAAPETQTKTDTTVGAAQPHIYAAATEEQTENEDGADADAAQEPTVDKQTLSPGGLSVTTSAADGWVENGNVVFSFTVFLTKDAVADALDGYEGKPYSNANFPEKGVIGIGYAMTVEEAEHILYDVLDTPLGPTENPERTTELCCIVVTEEEISSSSIGK